MKSARRLSGLSPFVGLLFLSFFSFEVFASSGITYQGRLMDPSGQPVMSSSVQFKLQIRTPGAEDCLLYEEIQGADLSVTKGVFGISLGDGTGTRTDGHSWSLFDALSNRKDFSFGGGECNGSPSNFTPSSNDNRKFKVFFNLGSGWESLPVQTINYIPMSIESYAVGGFPASSLLRVEDAGSLVNTAPLSNTQYVELLALLGGSSAQYEHTGQLGGSALPSLGAGQTMVSDGSGGWSAALPLTSESDPTVQAFAQTALPTCTTGEALVSNGTTLSCVSVASGSLSESDIPKLTSAGNGVDGGAISGEIGGSTSVNTSGDLATTGDIGAGGDITAGGNVSSGSVSTGILSTTGGITSAGDVSVTGVGGKVSATNGEFRRLHLLDDQATPHYVEVRSPDPLTANYTLTLPGSLGSANQLLGMNNAGNALENKTLTAGMGVTITHSAGGIEIAASGSGGTVTSVTGTAPISVDNSNPNTPVVTLDDSGVGVGTYGSATEVPVITVDVKGRITSASNTTISGVSPAGSNLTAGKAWIGDGTGKATEAYINVSDLKKSDGTPQIPSTCTASQTMTWSSVTDVFTCSNIMVTKSQISDFPTLGTAALEDVGTSAGDVVQLDPSGKLPAVDGSQLTNLTLPSYDTTYFKQGGNDFSATATLGTTGNNDLNIITNNTPKMTVLANGNVGIGTTAPKRPLHISSSFPGGYSLFALENQNTTDGSYITMSFRSDSTGTGAENFSEYSGIKSTFYTHDHATKSAGLSLYTFSNGSAADRLTIDSNGNVGIGTASPGSLLHVNGAMYANSVTGGSVTASNSAGAAYSTASGSAVDLYSYSAFQLANTSNTKNWMLNYRNGTTIGADAEKLMFTYHNGSGTYTDHLTITPTGSVGIGTTAPSVSLDLGTKTDAVRLPAGTTAQQPTTPANGMIRYNSDNNKLEAYENGTWTNMIGGTASSATSVSAGAGSVGTPSISFSGDPDTGFYSSGTNSIGISAGGTKIWDLTTSGIISPTTGGASLLSTVGSASAPTFSFKGDEDTGWYLAAPDTLAASTGGAERVRIDSSGNVGIGTTNPGSQLEVAGALRLTTTTMDNYSTPAGSNVPTKINIPHFDPGPYGQILSMGVPSAADASSRILSLFDQRGVAHAPTLAVFSPDENKMIGFSWDGSNTIAAVKSTTSLALLADGDIQILPPVGSDVYQGDTIMGSTDYGAMLNMTTSSRVADGLALTIKGDLGGAGRSSIYLETNDNGNDRYLLRAVGNGGAAEALAVTSSGNVGIGTATPDSLLHLRGSSPVLNLQNTNAVAGNGGVLRFGHDQLSNQTPIGEIRGYLTNGNGAARAGDLTFHTSNAGTLSEKMRITSVGNVGIGTTNPSTPLSIYADSIALGDARSLATLIDETALGAGVGGGISFGGHMTSTGFTQFANIKGSKDNANSGENGGSLIFSTRTNGADPAERMRIDSSGNVGIGTANPTAKLEVNGTIKVSGQPLSKTFYIRSSTSSVKCINANYAPTGYSDDDCTWIYNGYAYYEGTTQDTFNVYTDASCTTLYSTKGMNEIHYADATNQNYYFKVPVLNGFDSVLQCIKGNQTETIAY